MFLRVQEWCIKLVEKISFLRSKSVMSDDCDKLIISVVEINVLAHLYTSHITFFGPPCSIPWKLIIVYQQYIKHSCIMKSPRIKCSSTLISTEVSHVAQCTVGVGFISLKHYNVIYPPYLLRKVPRLSDISCSSTWYYILRLLLV